MASRMTTIEEAAIRTAIAERERCLAAALGDPYYRVRPWLIVEMRVGIERLRKELT